MKSILCPVDLSRASRPALKMALALSRRLGARLHVLEVLDAGSPLLRHGRPLVAPIPAAVREAAQRRLDLFVRAARPTGISFTLSVVEGPVIRTILSTAHDVGAEIIVMGTHGRTGVTRLAFGSVAETILRQANCPVLVVPPGTRVPSVSFRTIVCGVDFMAPSRRGVAYAGQLAASRGRLVLAHAMDWPFGADTEQSPVPIRKLRLGLERTAAARLRRLERRVDRNDLRLSEEVGVGKASDHILRCARKHRADLIVMGPHGRASIRLALLGSTTQQVIQDAPCPVLTVRGVRAAGQVEAEAIRKPELEKRGVIVL